MTIKAQLFITCLAEQFFSPMLRDMVMVLERLGVQCEFPEAQTCCGQPLFNSGFIVRRPLRQKSARREDRKELVQLRKLRVPSPFKL